MHGAVGSTFSIEAEIIPVAPSRSAHGGCVPQCVRSAMSSNALAVIDFHSPQHPEPVLQRAHTSGIDIRRLLRILLWFNSALPIETIQPLRAGFIRCTCRMSRLSWLSKSGRILFSLTCVRALVFELAALSTRWRRLKAVCPQNERQDPQQRLTYRSLSPDDDATAEQQLFAQTGSRIGRKS
jgi:hypothetical protein